MIKRANKITALLVAAASVMSVVPAMATDSTSRLGTKDGTIERAVAFKDGKYAYQGYKDNSSDESVYYNAGGKDKQLSDTEDADLLGSYRDKYAFAKDGSDQYTVDLTNGSVSDDVTPEDDADNAATKLRSNLKKTDRYGEDITVDAKDNLGYDAANDDNSGILKGPKFGDTYYQYEVKTDSSDAKDNVLNGFLYGYTTTSGNKYIDTSNLANVYAYSTAKSKVVKVDEFTNKATLEKGDFDSDTGLLAKLKAKPKYLTQDKDYIYQQIEVEIHELLKADSTKTVVQTGTSTASAVTIKDGAVTVGTDYITNRTYIQKLAKAQGDQKDDAYLPKTVASYELVKDGNEFDCGDAEDARTELDNADSYSVVNGQLLAIKDSGDNVKVTSVNLKKDKVKYNKNHKDASGNLIHPTSISKDDKVDVYLAEKDSDDDVDYDEANASVDEYQKAFDIDVDGNVWVVAKGKVYEFKNNTMTKVYTCDSSFNAISVYDAKNMIIWDVDGDNYTTVNEGTAQTEADAGIDNTAIPVPAKTGWDYLADGTWNFYDTTGSKVVNNWANAGGVWYFLNDNGTMATGWQLVNGYWYYFNPISDGTRGSMKTGWVNVYGTWYFLNSSGAMATGWTNVNGTWYYLGESGAMATGWLNDNGTWYYLNGNGSMASNTKINGYRLGSSGALI